MKKINGRKLAWAVIHLIVFINLWTSDIGIEAKTFDDALKIIWYIAILMFFGWRFITNMEEAFA